METINEIQDEIIEEFTGLDDWMDRYQLLIDLGNEQEPLDEQYKTEQNLIDGCQSRVWLQADFIDEERGTRNEEGEMRKVIRFRAESDALIVKGIVSLLIRVLSGHTPQEIHDDDGPVEVAQQGTRVSIAVPEKVRPSDKLFKL